MIDVTMIEATAASRNLVVLEKRRTVSMKFAIVNHGLCPHQAGNRPFDVGRAKLRLHRVFCLAAARRPIMIDADDGLLGRRRQR
jgi:hypothetical protein